MNNSAEQNLDPLESQLARVPSGFAPPGLRTTVLGKVHRELRASRWDRRLGRAAALLLAVGVLMNVAVLRPHTGPAVGAVAYQPSPQALAELAVNVAEATDAETARQIVLHMATLSGLPLSGQLTEAIQQEIDRRLPSTAPNGKAG